MRGLEGHILGGCKLIRKLGTGGMGDVYLAEQQRVGNRLVAVKIVPDDEAGESPDAIRETQRHFQQEAALLGNLHHNNILPVYDSGIENGLLYLVTEYVPDGSLADAIKGTGKHKLRLPLPLSFTLDIISQTADALEYTHEKRVVHRDVKPGNVLIRVEPDGHWHVLLADYGVARTLNTNSPRTQVSGTFAYMAPEQFSGKYSPATDQYALAIMTFQLLAGRLPFEGEMAALAKAHMYDPVPSLHALNPDIPEALDAVLTRALAKNPDDRYPSTEAFVHAVRVAAGLDATTQRDVSVPLSPPQSAIHGAPAKAPPQTVTYVSQVVRPLRLGRIAVTGIVALALLVAVVVGSMWAQGTGIFAKTQPTQTTHAFSPVAATATSSPTLVACGSPVTGGQLGCFSTPPVSGGPVVLQSVSPLCDHTDYDWNFSSGVKDHPCPSNGGLTISATSSQTLACINAQSVTTTNGYASVQVTSASGPVVIGFRQNLTTQSTTHNIYGYYFWLFPQHNGEFTTYALYKVTETGTLVAVHQQSALATTPGQSFEMGVLYQGGTLTMYVDGNRITTSTDKTFTSGWFGMCTEGTATFQNAQIYSLGS